MGDLQFDPKKRDLVITNGDFTYIPDPSVQNGAVIRDAHCFSLRFPTFGIGLQRIINSPIRVINYEMNRWKQQAKNDGAKKADFSIELTNGHARISNTVSYD